MDATFILYTGASTPNIPMTPGQNLQTILQHIDTAINTHNAAPDYTGYSLSCVKQTDGTSHPTNTQNFAEGISKILCDLKTAYTTFSGTTYPANQTTLTNAISGLQLPALTYTPFSITNTDNVTQIWNKVFDGLDDMIAESDPSGATWSSISVSPAPANVADAFDDIISYIAALSTTVTGKQASIGTFNNSSNCLSGGATDSIQTTIGLLTTKVCALPAFASGSVTWGCVSSSSTLQGAINNIIAEIGSVATGYVSTAGTGLTSTALGSCSGHSVAIDTTWTGLYKVAVDVTDAGTAPGYLEDKIESSDSSITITNTGSTLDLSITTPIDGKVKVNSSGVADYLVNKIPSTVGDWGISLIAEVVADKLILTPQVQYPGTMAQTLMTYIQSDPDLLLQFSNLIATSQNVPGLGIIDLLVTMTGGNAVLTWTAQSGTSQQAKWRTRGQTPWNTSTFSPANPLSAVAVTSTRTPMNSNSVEQYQVDTIYPTGLVNSNMYEMVKFTCQADSHSVSTGIVSISQPALSGIDTIEYRLIKNAGSVLQQTIITSGLAPAVAFNAVAAGTYHVEWRYSAIINGNTLYSDDASQLNAMCTSSNITV